MKKQDDDSSFAAVNETAHKSDSEKAVSISSVAAHQLNDLDLVSPTEEEMNTLRHVPDKINWLAYSKQPSLFFRPFMAPVCL
jgi:POT family proton-dependent oligopeptide transporter